MKKIPTQVNPRRRERVPDDSEVGDHEAAFHPAVALRVFYWLYPVEHLLAQPQPKIAAKYHQHIDIYTSIS